MKIVIIGLGTIGKTILKRLASEEHTITIIDENKDLIESMIETYFFIFLAVLFLLSLDSVNGQMVTIVSDAGSYSVEHGFFSNFSAALTRISNVGPAFEAVGPYSSFAGYNGFSSIMLTLTMMLGRLAILPVLILFSRRAWQKM